MNEILQQFYDEIGEWILRGAAEGDVSIFDNTGLCSNLRNFMYRKRVTYGFQLAIAIELEYQFREAGLNPEYPFDDYRGFSYRDSMRAGTLYDNPLRREWVFLHMSKGCYNSISN